jgi:hypothetical protein
VHISAEQGTFRPGSADGDEAIPNLEIGFVFARVSSMLLLS